MSIITQEQFEKLANFKNELCISIFIPTQRGGKEVLEEQSKSHLKSKMDDIKRKLHKSGHSEEKITKIIAPIRELIQNKDFWRHQSDGLAIFASPGFFEKYTVPVHFEAYEHIANEFYIKPLVPLLSGDGRYYLLAIQVKGVSFYEASKYSITKIDIEDLTPSSLMDRVGFDYEEKALQFSASSHGEKNMHGHAGADRERKDEIFRYFRAVDEGLQPMLNKGKLPLVVACQDYFFPIYKDANTYTKLYEEAVPGNPSDTDTLGLHEKSWQVIEPFFEKTKKEKLKKYEEWSNTEHTSSSIHDIIPSALEGKIDSLFLENREEIWGNYDPQNRKVTIDDQQTNGNMSLMNLAAKKVLENGGNVFLIEPAFMPEKESKMNALFRYS
ncbi:MAG: hypothetical protein R6W85_10760 [Gillisia sp.]